MAVKCVYSIVLSMLLACVFPFVVQAASINDLRTYTIKGESYVPLKKLASFYGYKMKEKGEKTIELSSKWSAWTFTKKSRKAHFNGVDIWLHAPIRKVKRHWCITRADARVLVDPLVRKEGYLGRKGYKVVVLDPGHGGKDKGARSKRRHVEEKRAVLDIAKRVRKQLVNEGYKVYMTRDNDRYLSLDERCKKAARYKGDIFVSIHLNSSSSSTSKGIETYSITTRGYASTAGGGTQKSHNIKHPGNAYDHTSHVLAYYVQKALLKKTRTEDRGVRKARFYVLKNAPSTAVLVECGFISNPVEEDKIIDAKYRETVAQGITDGICGYFEAVKRAQVVGK